MIDPTQFNTLSLPLHSIVLLILYFVLAVYAIFSAIFYYHWKTYATDDKVATLTLVTYFSITIPILIIMSTMASIIN